MMIVFFLLLSFQNFESLGYNAIVKGKIAKEKNLIEKSLRVEKTPSSELKSDFEIKILSKYGNSKLRPAQIETGNPKLNHL